MKIYDRNKQRAINALAKAQHGATNSTVSGQIQDYVYLDDEGYVSVNSANSSLSFQEDKGVFISTGNINKNSYGLYNTNDKINTNLVVSGSITPGAIHLNHLGSDVVLGGSVGVSGLYVDEEGYVAKNGSNVGLVLADDLDLDLNSTGNITKNGYDLYKSGDVINDNLVVSGSITAGNVYGYHIVDETITGGKIADDAITSNHIGEGQISSYHIASASIVGGDIADLTLTSGKIANYNITAEKLNQPNNSFNYLSSVISSPPDGLSDFATGTEVVWGFTETPIVDELFGNPIWKVNASTTQQLIFGDLDSTIYGLGQNNAEQIHIVSCYVFGHFNGNISVSVRNSVDNILVGNITVASGVWTRSYFASYADIDPADDIAGIWVANSNTAPVYLTLIQIEKAESDSQTEPSVYRDGLNKYYSIGIGYIVPGTVDSTSLADSSVTSAKIVNGAIVNADINASAAIAGSKIATGGISATQLASNAVTTIKVLDYNITNAKLTSANEGFNKCEQRYSIPYTDNYVNWYNSGITVENSPVAFNKPLAFKVHTASGVLFVENSNKSYISTLNSGTVNLLSLWCYSTAQVDDVVVTLYGSDDVAVGNSTFQSTSTWNRVSMPITPSATKTDGYIKITNPSPTYPIYFKGLMVERVDSSEPSHTIASAYSPGDLSNYITNTMIRDGSITNDELANGAVTFSKTTNMPRGEIIWCSSTQLTTNPAAATDYAHATSGTDTYETPIRFTTKIYPETTEIILNLQMNQTTSATASGIAEIAISGLNSIGYYSATTTWLPGVATGAYTTLSGVISVAGLNTTDLCWVEVRHKSSSTARVNTIKHIVVEKNTYKP